jgi:hypothetical protein
VHPAVQRPPAAGTTGDRHAQHVACALAIEVGLILAAAIALLAMAMGVRNATVRRLAVPDLTTTVLTMTLTGRREGIRKGGGVASACS